MKRRNIIIVIVAIAIILLAGYFTTQYFLQPKVTLKVFCAGSLKIPLDQLASIYEEKYDVKVEIEASGSVEAARKVIDLGKPCDVLAVADYRLFEQYMYPEHTEWYAAFASNEVVLAFTSNSKYADYIIKNPDKWYEVLAKKDVKFGFSDPNKDPCGYRAVGVIALASIYYNNESILKDLILSKTNIEASVSASKIDVYVPASLEKHARDLEIRSKSVDLIALLEAGSLDYAFEYKSVAKQHNLLYIELPEKINLKNPGYDDFYSKVTVHILVGSEREASMTMKSIVYGVTIPKCAKYLKEAIEFVKLLLSEVGRDVFSRNGQDFLEKPIFYGNAPSEIKG